MEFNPDIEIKEENLLNSALKIAERLCYEDDNHFLDFDLDVKVENILPHNDWCLQEGDILQDNEDNLTSTSYEELNEDQKQTCLLCGHFFPNNFLFLQHNLNHLKVPLVRRTLFICYHCYKYYKKKRDLERHISFKHPSKSKSKKVTELLYECKICNKKNMFYKAWHGHMNTVHAKDRIKCTKCPSLFKCERYLKRHMLYVHNGLRPNWRFRSNSMIEQPMVKCDQCPGVYANNNALKTHTRNCHSESVQCDLCKSKLKSKSYLMTHMLRVHYDDGELHSCDICGKTFKSPRYVNVHIKNMHTKKILKS